MMRLTDSVVRAPGKRRILLPLLALLCAALLPAARPADAPAQPAEEAVSSFWIESPHTRPAAAVQVVGVRDPFLTAGLLASGKTLVAWGLESPPEFAPPLTREWLQAVAHDKAFPDLRRKIGRASC